MKRSPGALTRVGRRMLTQTRTRVEWSVLHSAVVWLAQLPRPLFRPDEPLFTQFVFAPDTR